MRKPIKFISLLVGSLTLVSGLAQSAPATPEHRRYGAWNSSVIGSGGYLQHAVFAPSNPARIYLSSDVGGLFRSDDSGRTWRMLHGALPADAGNYSVRGVLVDPKNADRVTVAFDTGVWRSDDAGKTWRRLLPALFAGNGDHRSDGRVLVFSPRDTNTLHAAPLGTGVHTSTDGGKTWRVSGPTGLYPTDLYIDNRDPRRLWLSARPAKHWVGPQHKSFGGGLFLSEDGGANWQQIAAQGMREIHQDPNDPSVLIAITPGPERVVRSTDLGRTWSKFDTGLAPASKDVRKDGDYGALATGPDFTLLGGNGASIYRLDRGATAWTKIAWNKADVHEGNWWGGLSKHGYPHFGSALGWLAIDPSNPRHWLLTDWYALYRSPDAGKSWHLSIDGIEMTVAHVITQDPAHPNHVHLGVADIGYMRSTDGGATFQPNNQTITNNIKHIAACLERPQRLYAVGPQTWHWHANQVFMSDDGGTTWARSPMTGLPNMKDARCNTIAVHPRKPDEVWLVIDGPISSQRGGTWKSTDGGNSWAWVGEGLPEGARLFRTDIWVAGPEIAVSADDSAVAGSDDTGRLFSFDPAASRWTEIPALSHTGGINAVVADAATPGRFYVARKEGGLWRSDDGGKAWTQVSTHTAWTVAVDALNPRRVALNGYDGIYLSLDAAKTWKRLDEGLPYRHPRNVIAFAGNRLVVGTGGNGAFWREVAR